MGSELGGRHAALLELGHPLRTGLGQGGGERFGLLLLQWSPSAERGFAHVQVGHEAGLFQLERLVLLLLRLLLRERRFLLQRG